MFEGLPTAPPDAIFGLMAAYRQDSRPDKINLGAGIYLNEAGQAPILAAVKQAEQRIWKQETTKSYLPIEGDPRLARLMPKLLLGDDHPAVGDSRLVSVHTPGGTGAIRVIAEVLRAHRPGATVWIPEQTWINHPKIFAAAGLGIEPYPYLDSGLRRLEFEATCQAFRQLRTDDLVVLHGCCHNPSGIDFDLEQWSTLGKLLAERGAVPLVDIAYQGFGEGVEEDALGVRAISREVSELIICVSFSKNFALYNERVGGLVVVAPAAAPAAAILSQIKLAARTTYSNPPVHGAAIVASILTDADLRELWRRELSGMRERIQRMRRLFVDSLDQRGVELSPTGNGFLLRQRGMFSFSGLDGDQVARLRGEDSIYIVGSGRINFAGMNPGNVPRLCEAIARVV